MYIKEWSLVDNREKYQNDRSVILLWFLMNKIYQYEEGIFDMIVRRVIDIPDTQLSLKKRLHTHVSISRNMLGLYVSIIWENIVEFENTLDGVYIGKNVFSGCKKIKKINLGSKVGFMDKKVFYNCRTLETVILPINIVNIPDGTFCLCHSLKNIRLPGTLRSIGTKSFFECKNLKNIVFPEGLESIGISSFSRCYHFRKLVFPASLRYIKNAAFSECTFLQEVVFLGKNVKMIETYAFFDCNNLEKIINIPVTDQNCRYQYIFGQRLRDKVRRSIKTNIIY
jgi:hypothetical protein